MKTPSLNGLIAVFPALCLLATPAVLAQGQGRGGPQDLPGDTNAATECGPGEVLVADGTPDGICFPLDYNFNLRFIEESTCPCDFLGAIYDPYTWRLDQARACYAVDTEEFFEAGYFSLNGKRTNAGAVVDSLNFVQNDFPPHHVFCVSVADNVVQDFNVNVPTESELDDCIADIQAVAAALGVTSCEPPELLPLP